jgi:acetoacetyl-CoA synthetase
LAEAFGAHGRSRLEEVGELPITAPLSSKPLFLWNDPGGKRQQESYFERYLGVWRTASLSQRSCEDGAAKRARYR